VVSFRALTRLAKPRFPFLFVSEFAMASARTSNRHDLLRVVIVAAAVISVACQAADAQQSTAKPVSFHNDIHPILQRKCQGCHQPAKPNGKLVLTTFEYLSKGGEGPMRACLSNR